MSHLFQKKKVLTRGIEKNRCSSRVVAFQAAGREKMRVPIDVQLRTIYAGPDAADRHEWGLLETR